MTDIIQQRKWTESELRAQGFQHYKRKKELVMAGRLPPTRAPMTIRYTLEIVIAEVGDILCFDPGAQVMQHFFDYDYWSVKPMIFRQTYREWDDSDWKPNPPQLHLMRYGCRPYFKFAGVWAKILDKPVYVQSLESPKPALIPVGAWLTIGTMGEPWHMGDDSFRNRYHV
ncbi:MAG TPA: hypothetical protein VHL11_05470, partial [Phototrophicaceae bacterium]|nr:hypothetical protein [Phototrophicaceae bacterium]